MPKCSLKVTSLKHIRELYDVLNFLSNRKLSNIFV